MAEKKYVIDNAKLMAEWDWEKNNKLGFDPKILTLGSEKKTLWKCSKGHELNHYTLKGKAFQVEKGE